jgi:signal transduction histidine kinase/CheY-like chemotaxis protein
LGGECSMATKILIVDDELLVRRALAEHLAGCGYETVTAADGVEGLAKARAERFDVMLVDLRMPRVDGLEVIAMLREEQPELPMVVVSGAGVLEDAVEAMRRGAWDYVTKPIQDIGEIAVVVERVLEKARLIAERDRYRRELEQLNRSLEAEVSRQTVNLLVQNRRLMALNRVSYAISDPLDLDTMLNRAIDAAVAAFEADGGVVRLIDSATDHLVIAAARGLPESYLASAQAIPLGQGIIGRVAQEGRPCTGEDFATDPWLAPLQDEGFRSFLCAPFRAGSESDRKHPIVGILGILTRTERDFDTNEVDLLTTIGNQIGVAVARVQYAADLKRTNVRLEQANVELRTLDTLREQFIQNVTHELRTPLALVHGYVEMLAQGELGPGEQKMALDVTSRGVEKLVELVEAVTTLQDLGSQPLRIGEITLAELVHTACQMASQRASATDIELRCDYPADIAPFPGDFTRLTQALYQLLDNACKFSPEGSVVTITGQMAPAGDAICISVADQGIGIPPEEHLHIFKRFYQVDGSITRRYGGAGLGLALVKEIVEAHRGTVGVESDVGAGSTFTICLPVDGATAEGDEG